MIIIEPLDLAAITSAAETGYPDEVCGLLVGHWPAPDHCRVDRVVASENLSRDRSKSFEIDPALRLDLQRELRGSTNGVVGLFHSHPDQSAQPSARDLERAWEPDLVWLVTSVLAGAAVLTTAHVIAQSHGRQRFAEIPIHTSDWQPDHEAPAAAGPGLSILTARQQGSA